VVASSRLGGLESLEGTGPSQADAVRAVDRMSEGVWGSDKGDDDGLEAIIQRFTRPVQLIQDNSFRAPADTFPRASRSAIT